MKTRRQKGTGTVLRLITPTLHRSTLERFENYGTVDRSMLTTTHHYSPMKYNTITRTSIATHLEIAGSDILSIESWVYVFYVHIRGIGYRFISKAIVVDRSEMNYYQYDRAILATQEQIKTTSDALVADIGRCIQASAIDAGMDMLTKLDRNLTMLLQEFNTKY